MLKFSRLPKLSVRENSGFKGDFVEKMYAYHSESEARAYSKVRRAMVFISALRDTIHGPLHDVSSFRPLCKGIRAKWTYVSRINLVMYDTAFKSFQKPFHAKYIHSVRPTVSCALDKWLMEKSDTDHLYLHLGL
jgi:hypothetical protein